MLKTIVRILLVVAVVVIAVCATAFFGNPVSKFLVTRNAGNYLEENYKNKDCYIDVVKFDFKTGNYYVLIKSETSADSSFTLYADMNGKIVYDTYESSVVQKWNTANRINYEYRSVVEKVFEGETFPYNQHIAFGDIEFYSDERGDGDSQIDYAIFTESLVLDGTYDINDIGKKAGHLTVYIYDNDVSTERLAEILLGIRNLMDESEVGFYAIDCVIEYPNPGNDEPWKEGRVEVMSFLYKDIYEEGIIKRVTEADQKAKDYYKNQNDLKLQENIQFKISVNPSVKSGGLFSVERNF